MRITALLVATLCWSCESAEVITEPADTGTRDVTAGDTGAGDTGVGDTGVGDTGVGDTGGGTRDVGILVDAPEPADASVDAEGSSQSGLCPEANSSTNDLLRRVVGFGREATGGLGGQVYQVTRQDDALELGTLRYAIEELDGPTWIVFSADVFPVETPTAIELESPLYLRDDVTIDGRGSQVVVRKRYNWADAEWAPARPGSTTYECTAVASPSRDMRGLLVLRSTKNVVLSHLRFEQLYEGTVPSYELLDKQCFGDVISIYNSAGDQATDHYGPIWIHRSDFADCADECLGITRASEVRRAYLTISNNRFRGTYKTVLLGGGNAEPFTIAATIQANHFMGNRQRQPRVQNAVAHVYNNLFEDWVSYGVGVFDNSRVMVEQNVFLANRRAVDAVRVYGSEDVALWARDNLSDGVANPDVLETRSFPDCEEGGGPWYNDCVDDIQPYASLPIGDAAGLARVSAGWRSEFNEVRRGCPE